jgi:transcriptional regulator with XRE-family HTH domain
MMTETEQMLKILRTAVRVLGFTNQDIEDKLGVYHGYLGRLFKGAINLQFEDIVRIAHALDMEPAEIFQLAYPQAPRPATGGAQRLRASLDFLQPPPSAPEPPPAAAEPPATSGLTSALEQELDRLVRIRFEKLMADLVRNAAKGE